MIGAGGIFLFASLAVASFTRVFNPLHSAKSGLTHGHTDFTFARIALVDADRNDSGADVIAFAERLFTGFRNKPAVFCVIQIGRASCRERV